MSDKLNPEQRHYCMSRVKSADTRPEILVRKYLHSKGFRYSLHKKSLPGCPDIVLKRYHTVIFVNGCFWHVHPGCKYSVIPATNRTFWIEKFEKNKERDARNISLLEELGWHVIIVWECELKKDVRENNLRKVEKIIRYAGICPLPPKIEQ